MRWLGRRCSRPKLRIPMQLDQHCSPSSSRELITSNSRRLNPIGPQVSPVEADLREENNSLLRFRSVSSQGSLLNSSFFTYYAF